MEKDQSEVARLKAMDKCLYASRLLAPEHFSKFVSAMQENDEQRYLVISKEAGIPEELAKEIYEGLLKGFFNNVKFLQWP